jgi:hypothetical protein
MSDREEIYRMDPERERLAMIEGRRGRKKGQRDAKPRRVTQSLIDSILRAGRMVTSESRSRGRMTIEPARRSEIARKAAEVRWGKTA